MGSIVGVFTVVAVVFGSEENAVDTEVVESEKDSGSEGLGMAKASVGPRSAVKIASAKRMAVKSDLMAMVATEGYKACVKRANAENSVGSRQVRNS